MTAASSTTAKFLEMQDHGGHASEAGTRLQGQASLRSPQQRGQYSQAQQSQQPKQPQQPQQPQGHSQNDAVKSELLEANSGLHSHSLNDMETGESDRKQSQTICAVVGRLHHPEGAEGAITTHRARLSALAAPAKLRFEDLPEFSFQDPLRYGAGTLSFRAPPQREHVAKQTDREATEKSAVVLPTAPRRPVAVTRPSASRGRGRDEYIKSRGPYTTSTAEKGLRSENSKAGRGTHRRPNNHFYNKSDGGRTSRTHNSNNTGQKKPTIPRTMGLGPLVNKGPSGTNPTNHQRSCSPRPSEDQSRDRFLAHMGRSKAPLSDSTFGSSSIRSEAVPSNIKGGKDSVLISLSPDHQKIRHPITHLFDEMYEDKASDSNGSDVYYSAEEGEYPEEVIYDA